MNSKYRILLDILIVTVLLLPALAGCVNAGSASEETESLPSAVSESEVSETEITTTTSETTTQTKATTDPTYEEAAAYVRELLDAGNTPEEVIAILMDEGRTEFDATALVNSVLMDGATVSSSSVTKTTTVTEETITTTASGSSGSTTTNATVQTTTEATTQTTSSNKPSATTPTSATTATTATETTPSSSAIPTKVKQTIYIRIVWDDQDIETMAAQGIDLNAERPEAVGVDIYACDANGNFNAGTIIDSSGGDAAELQLYAEADAILAKYGLTEGDYSYTAYKIENEYLYD